MKLYRLFTWYNNNRNLEDEYTWLSSIRRRQVIGEGFFLSSHVRRIRARYQDRKINVSGNSSAELIHKFDSNRTHWFERIAPFLTFAPHDGSYLPYRRPFFDFTTGSGCNSTSLRTDSRRLAALATRCDLPAGRDRPRSSGFSLGREGGGREGSGGGTVFTVGWKWRGVIDDAKDASEFWGNSN